MNQRTIYGQQRSSSHEKSQSQSFYQFVFLSLTVLFVQPTSSMPDWGTIWPPPLSLHCPDVDLPGGCDSVSWPKKRQDRWMRAEKYIYTYTWKPVPTRNKSIQMVVIIVIWLLLRFTSEVVVWEHSFVSGWDWVSKHMEVHPNSDSWKVVKDHTYT